MSYSIRHLKPFSIRLEPWLRRKLQEEANSEQISLQTKMSLILMDYIGFKKNLKRNQKNIQNFRFDDDSPCENYKARFISSDFLVLKALFLRYVILHGN